MAPTNSIDQATCDCCGRIYFDVLEDHNCQCASRENCDLCLYCADHCRCTPEMKQRFAQVVRTLDEQLQEIRVENIAFVNANRLAQVSQRACRVCGCTDNEGCLTGCFWIEADLCSN